MPKTHIQQHYIPKVYLKYFQIDNEQNKNFVYCLDLSSKYNRKIQRLGISNKIFTEKKFYTDDRLYDHNIIEKVLGEDFEPKYNSIIKEITKEVSPPKDAIGDLLIWLWISKIRSPVFRTYADEIITFVTQFTNKINRRNLSEEDELIQSKSIRIEAKRAHLNLLSNEEDARDLLKEHIDTLNCKHWQILISLPDFPFWTNDNPGFSRNVDPRFSDQTPFHPILELNNNSEIFYVLTPKYCLHITPFKQGDPMECALTMDVKFKQINAEAIGYINKGVLYTSHKLIISNSLELLQFCATS